MTDLQHQDRFQSKLEPRRSASAIPASLLREEKCHLDKKSIVLGAFWPFQEQIPVQASDPEQCGQC